MRVDRDVIETNERGDGVARPPFRSAPPDDARLAEATAVDAAAIVLTSGTFMRGLMHTGETATSGGRVGEGGLLDTDHVFEIQPLDAKRIRFDHFEEFRGSLAEKMDEEMRGFTRRAFQAMNEALAARVRALS